MAESFLGFPIVAATPAQIAHGVRRGRFLYSAEGIAAYEYQNKIYLVESESLASAILQDGSLSNDWPCIAWAPVESSVILEGKFTPTMLRMIAAHMEMFSKT